MQVLKPSKKINFSPLLRRYTLKEFWSLPEPEDRSHYDLIGGYLFMVPPPHPPHGSIDDRMNRSLMEFLIKRNVQGEVHHPREPIYIQSEWPTSIEPDMMFLTAELAAHMSKQRSSADIVFEYLSESTRVYDQTTKADTYLALGVKELWLIDPITVRIEVRHATGEKGQLTWQTLRYPKGTSAVSRVLGGWEVSVDELFDGLTG